MSDCKCKSVFTTIAVITAGAASVYAASKFIRSRVNKHKEQKYPTLGFEWNFMNRSANVLDGARQFKNELKWGFQRFTRGYDDTMFWDFDHYMDKLIIADLRWMIENRNGSPVLEDKGWTEENCHEKFTEILKKMLYHFEQSQDEYCSELNGFDYYTDDEVEFIDTGDGFKRMEHINKSAEAEAVREKSFQRWREIEEYKSEHHRQALEMLKEYYRYLWD